MSYCEVVTFPLGQEWCLFVSIPDLCPLSLNGFLVQKLYVRFVNSLSIIFLSDLFIKMVKNDRIWVGFFSYGIPTKLLIQSLFRQSKSRIDLAVRGGKDMLLFKNSSEKQNFTIFITFL